MTSETSMTTPAHRTGRTELALKACADKLQKISDWLEKLAFHEEQRAKDLRWKSLAEASRLDAKNHRATLADIQPVIDEARAALSASRSTGE